MPLFPVETYRVSSHLDRPSGVSRPSRVLEVAGPIGYHGIQDRALFSFHPSFDGTWSAPVAGYLTAGRFGGVSLVGWMPLAEFPLYYDILRSERPVHVSYERREAGAESGYLRTVGLGTSTEPVGEGPSESASGVSKALAERLVASPLTLGAAAAPMPLVEDLPEGALGAAGPGAAPSGRGT